MKNFFKNHGFQILFGLLCTFIVCAIITINFDNLISEIQYKTDKQFEDKTSYKKAGKIISFGDKNMSNSPESAYIENGVLKISAKLTNNTVKNLKIRNFAVIRFGGYEFAGNVIFDGDGTINSGSELKVTYEVNVSTFKYINAVPTTINVELETDDQYENYEEYDLKYVVSWY